jgi:shikimate dehydrogenase
MDANDMIDSFEIITRSVPTMYFFGVTTGQSFSRRVFPAWAKILGQPEAELVGVDLPINGPVEGYRRAVAQIKHDPLSLGGLVTTHKINTLRAARDLFDELTPDAEMTGEISSIYKRKGRLFGHAADPVNAGISMQHFISEGYWRDNRAHILCLGAGGSAVAIAVHLSRALSPEDRPARVVFVNRSRPRLDDLAGLVRKKLPPSGIDYAFVENSDPAVNDRLMADLPPGSLVINATGMGKDTPGSPITDRGQFPPNGIAWELNYRGALDFLHQAEAQAAARGLTVEDGWYYFLVGWGLIMGQVLDVEITPPIFARLAEAAEALR